MARRSTAWKYLEKHAAHTLGGQRNPAAQGVGGPDVVGVDGWVIEAKYRATFTHDTLYRSEKKKRTRDLSQNGSRFCLVTRARGKEPLVILALQDFEELVKPSLPTGEGEPLHQGTESPLPGLGEDTAGAK